MKFTLTVRRHYRTDAPITKANPSAVVFRHDDTDQRHPLGRVAHHDTGWYADVDESTTFGPFVSRVDAATALVIHADGESLSDVTEVWNRMEVTA